MPQFAVEFHPLAADEAQAAERWYRERNESASGRFQRELDRAIERISERPEAGFPYLSNTRRVLLRRFPFFVVYRYAATSRSLPSRTRVVGPDTGERVNRRFRWSEEPSARTHLESHIDLRWTAPRSRDEIHERASRSVATERRHG
jgi:plasmid stabilization system protein ParE